MYVPLYLLWNKPHMYLIPCLSSLSHNMVAAWTNFLGGYLCYTVPIAGRGWQSRSLSDSKHNYTSDVIYMRKQVCSSEEAHYSSARVQQWMVVSDTSSIEVVTFHLRVLLGLCQWLLELWPWLIVLVDLWQEKHSWQEISSCLDLKPKTWSLNVTGPPGALLFDRDQRSHWNNHYNCCFVQVAALGIYCTDFLPQILIQVKYPMQSVGHHIWWETEHIFETVATFCCQILTALSEEIWLHWATMHWTTGIKNNERICHLGGNDTSHYQSKGN